jgi:hypothetical protein
MAGVVVKDQTGDPTAGPQESWGTTNQQYAVLDWRAGGVQQVCSVLAANWRLPQGPK